MAFLFGRNRPPRPQDVVKSAKELLQRLIREEGQGTKVSTAFRDVRRNIADMSRSKKSSRERCLR